MNETLLPEGYFAEEHAQLGPWVEIDVATFTDLESSGRRATRTVTLPPRVWAPPAPTMIVPAAFPDAFEVLVFEDEGGTRLVAAIELVSPGNKDRPRHRQAFAVKCASYLCRGVSLIIIDIVTSRRENLHNEIMQVLGHGPASALPPEAALYAVAYRPIVREQHEQIEVWPSMLEIGQPLPVLPLCSMPTNVCRSTWRRHTRSRANGGGWDEDADIRGNFAALPPLLWASRLLPRMMS